VAEPSDDISTIPYALVVDDDALVLMTSCDLLEEADFRFYEAGSGDEAKALLKDRGDSITLLFTAVEMLGETNGFAHAHHVAGRSPEIEIIVASGRVNDMPDNATFISKPFSAQVVHDHLRKTLPDGKKPAPLKAAAQDA
jgi:DNA-binding NtrC family response regulator